MSEKQKSTINIARNAMPAAAMIPPSKDFLIYIIKHTFLLLIFCTETIIPDQVCHKTDFTYVH